MIQWIIRMRSRLFILSRQRKFQPKPTEQLRKFCTIRRLYKLALVARHRRLVVIASWVTAFRTAKVKIQSRKHTIRMQDANFGKPRIFRKFSVPARIRKIVIGIVRRSVLAIKFVIVIAMPRRQRRTHRGAIRQAGELLRRSLPRVVAAVT